MTTTIVGHPKGTRTVCPLGLCRIEEDCPNAPCVDCMHRLGEHMIEEIRVIERQALIAKARGEAGAYEKLRALVDSLGIVATAQERLTQQG